MQNTGATLYSLRLLGRRALSWWLGELLALAPAPLIALMSIRRDTVIAFMANDGVRLALQNRRGIRHLGTIPAVNASDTVGLTPDGPADLLAAALPDAEMRRLISAGRLPVGLRVPAQKALRTSLVLPAAAERDLHPIISLQLDRRTPFTPETGCFSCRVASRENNQLRVEITVVSRAVVVAALDLLGRFGLKACRVDVAEAATGEALCSNLMPELEDRRRPRGAARLIGGLAAACAVLGLFWLQHDAAETVVRLQQEVAGVKAAAEEAQQLREAIEKVGEGARFLAQSGTARTSASVILNELSQVIPDNTWLMQLTVNDRQIDIAGYSDSAAALIPLIVRSDRFSEPRFRSAVQLDAALGKERFELTIGIAGEARQ